MKKSKIMQEHISALMDAELTDEQVVAILASQDQEMRKTWETYHQIGDVLRSEEMAVGMRPDFAARLAARLDAEPVIVAPAMAASRKQRRAAASLSFPGRFAVPAMVAATIAAVAIFAGTSLNGDETGLEQVTPHAAPAGARVVADSAKTLPKEAMMQARLDMPAAGSAEEHPQEVILRDPHIDEYLMAHQRFAPSVYSTAPYTRASAFAGKPEAGQ